MSGPVVLSGAYAGTFTVLTVHIEIPALQAAMWIRAVAAHNPPPGFDGIACFRFLKRFSYGNFGDPGKFGLEL
jgi:hypothetical protein